MQYAHELAPHYYALALVIKSKKRIHVEAALDYIETGRPIFKRGSNEDFEDTLEMIRLREDEKLTYREIGEMFGMEGTSIHARIKRHKAKR